MPGQGRGAVCWMQWRAGQSHRTAEVDTVVPLWACLSPRLHVQLLLLEATDTRSVTRHH